jgi:hypothetical protein
MYNIKDAVCRFKSDHTMYIAHDDINIYGYVWFNKYLDGVYLQNLFMIKSKLQKWRATEFLSSIIINLYNSVKIYCDIDDWNILSQKAALELGFLKKG